MLGPVASRLFLLQRPPEVRWPTVGGRGVCRLVLAYVLVAGELFAARDAGWRVPVLLCMSGFGMASGGWFAGMLYDHLGYDAPAFAAGLMFSLVHLALIATLVI